MMMNMHDYDYTVYDAVNDRLTQIESLYKLEEDNPVNSWQVVKRNGNSYLYNIGARRYASISSNGGFTLSSTPVTISMKESENGIIIGDNGNQQWGFVLNEKVQADANITGIDGIVMTSTGSEEYYSVGGQRFSNMQKGVNIIRMSNGTTKKIVVKK